MFDEYYEDLYRDHHGSPYVESAEYDPEPQKCALCQSRAFAKIDYELFCINHVQEAVDYFHNDDDENLKIEFL